MKYLLFLICLSLPAYLIRFNIAGIPTTLLEILIYLVFIIGLYQSFRSPKPVKYQIFLPALLILIGAFIGTLISPDKRTALGQFKAFFVDPVLVFWLVITFIKKKDFNWLLSGLLGSGTIVALFSIYEKIIGHLTPDGRVIGIFGYSPNYVALFLAPMIVLAISYLLSVISTKKYFLITLSLILASLYLYALYLSGSRGGELAVINGVIAYLIFANWQKIASRLWLKISLLGAIILIILGAYWSFKPNFNNPTGRIASSNNVRAQIWQTSIEMGREHPLFGLGLGNFQPAFEEFTKDRPNFAEYISPEAVTPHNIFLLFWLTTGIFGLIGFIGIVAMVYRQGFKDLSESASPALLAIMTTLLLHGLVDAAYFKNDLSLVFWLICGMILII